MLAPRVAPLFGQGAEARVLDHGWPFVAHVISALLFAPQLSQVFVDGKVHDKHSHKGAQKIDDEIHPTDVDLKQEEVTQLSGFSEALFVT